METQSFNRSKAVGESGRGPWKGVPVQTDAAPPVFRPIGSDTAEFCGYYKLTGPHNDCWNWQGEVVGMFKVTRDGDERHAIRTAPSSVVAIANSNDRQAA